MGIFDFLKKDTELTDEQKSKQRELKKNVITGIEGDDTRGIRASNYYTASGANNTVYSGADTSVFAVYGKDTVLLGSAQTLSYSIHREKFPVRRLGRTYAQGYTRGPRTIAGSMVFVDFESTALSELFKNFKYNSESPESGLKYDILPDQLPPFDLLVIFYNEAGSISIMRLLGVEIADEGSVLGVNEAYPETTMQYLAHDISLLRKIKVTATNDELVWQDDSLNDAYHGILKDNEVITQEISKYFDHHADGNDDLVYESSEITDASMTSSTQ
ncbi:hypothetical protein [Acinetobacter sp.]|uniref:hypothetical protein n=1 Tax=Acinetobacter sp. TaxID=472 RepID=UPI003D02B508